MKKYNKFVNESEENHSDIDPYGEENWGDRRQEPGVCPRCGNEEDLMFGEMRYHETWLEYEMDCTKCGYSGYEVYNLEFVRFDER